MSLSPYGEHLANSFGIPQHLVAAPIAGNWEGYNVTDNQGELIPRVATNEPQWNRQKESQLNTLVAGAAIA